MSRLIARRGVLHAGLACCALALAPRARACEFFSSNLRVFHPWTHATEPGRDSAAVSMIFDQVTRADRLIAVETPVAEGAEMGGAEARPAVDFAIPEGRESALAVNSTYLRLVRLKQPLEVGRSYPLKLVFESGDVVAAALNVDYMRFR
ncbi:MAG TPA: copper chaperone PCu(A)C [Burkholderiaceae bacterium]|nr:copper chaperone PCu(A)C [Burkholderiaceae bacterium]